MRNVYKVRLEGFTTKHTEYVIALNAREALGVIEANYGSVSMNDVVSVKVLGQALNDRSEGWPT